MHHALYIEVNNGRFRGILDFSKDGLLYLADQKDIDIELDGYATKKDCEIIPVEFDDNALWSDIVSAIREVAYLSYHVLAWNCQDYTRHIISKLQKK